MDSDAESIPSGLLRADKESFHAVELRYSVAQYNAEHCSDCGIRRSVMSTSSLSVGPPSSCAFLISSSSPRRFASARSRSSRQRTAQALQLPTGLSPAHVLLLLCLCPLRLYVRRCNTTPSPWWLLCPQWSVLPTTRAARAPIRVDRQCLWSVSCLMPVHLYVLITPAPRRSSAERRYEKRRVAVTVASTAFQRRSTNLPPFPTNLSRTSRPSVVFVNSLATLLDSRHTLSLFLSS